MPVKQQAQKLNGKRQLALLLARPMDTEQHEHPIRVLFLLADVGPSLPTLSDVF